MPLVVAGLDHRSAPTDVFKTAMIPGDGLELALGRLSKSEHFSEVVVLSTCLRTEIYVDAIRFHGAVADLRAFFSEITGLPVDQVSDSVVERYEQAACQHLFSLAAGVQSVMVGEGEILGQLGRAWQAAQLIGTSRSVLNGLFRHALVTGKRARNETKVGTGVTSLGTAAVALAGNHAHGIAGKSVLVVGAGDVAVTVALAAQRAGVGQLTIANRTSSRAAELAERVGGSVVELNQLGKPDVVISATSAPEPVIHSGSFEGQVPSVVIDLGMPCDVDDDLGKASKTELLRLDDVQRFVNEHQSERLAAVETVNAIVEQEVNKYFADVNARVVVPLLRELHEGIDHARQLEMTRFSSRLSTLDAEQRQTVDELTTALINKIFHNPTIALKTSAGTPEGERLAESVRRLFDL